MPVRIYALAKDWKMDSKELADLCHRAGIPGKGSALASLEDEEVAKLKGYLENAQKKAAAHGSAATPVAPATQERPRVEAPIRPGADRGMPLGTGRKPGVMAPALRKATVADTAAESVELPATPAAEAAKPISEKPATEQETAAPVAAETLSPAPSSAGTPTKETAAPTVVASALASPPLRADHSTPTRGSDGLSGSRGKGPIRVMDRGQKSSSEAVKRKEDGGALANRTPRDREPAIRLAAMPNVKQPEQKQPVQPAAQKPKIRLTAEALKSGGPLENVLKNLEKPKVDPKKGKPQTGTAAAPLSDQMKGKKGVPGKKDKDDTEGAGGGMDAIRKERQVKRGVGVRSREEEDSGYRRRGRRITRIKGHTTTAPRKSRVQIVLPCTIRSFCEEASVTTAQVMKVLMGMGMMLTINSPIPDEYVEMISAELGLDLEIKQPQTLEEEMLEDFQPEEDPALLEVRPPIATFLGHVDHGKTSLLDRLIGINVVSGEAGGITQHIRAYTITTKAGRKISFVDTPGHAAFTEMRARGANVTDIAVLVVAADDGIMQQTEEAINHAKAANVPIIVAMNKIDLPGANPQRVLEQLAAHELLPSEWGGQVEVVRTSAVTGQGMEELLDTILLSSDIFEFKANPHRTATGTCLEAEQEPGRGIIAKVMVRNGTLREGDVVVCGAAHGRVKAMYDTLDASKRLKEAGPSTPVNLTGLDIPPNAGDVLHVLDDIAKAREIAAQRAEEQRNRSLAGVTKRVSLEEFQRRLAEGNIGREEEKATLNLVIRADVRGSIEAIQNEFSKFEHPEVQIRVLQAAVGGITVADVTLASASDAVVVGFNVIPDENARSMAEERGVEIRRYSIIYNLTDDIKSLLEGKLKPEERVIDTGRVVVKQVFNISRVGVVAGCYVIQGSVERHSRVRVFRDGRIVGDYAIDTLRREKDDTKEVSRGMECGLKLSGFNDVRQDDVFEVYKTEEVARTL